MTESQALQASVDVESVIIGLVRERQFLYDKHHTMYKDRMTNINGWSFIGEQLSLSGDSCQKIWEGIRKQYTNYLSKLKKKTGDAAKPDPHFRHKYSMEFYKSHYKPHRGLTVSNFDEQNTSTSSKNEEEEEDEPINPSILFSADMLSPYLVINETKEIAEQASNENTNAKPPSSSSSSASSSSSSFLPKGKKRKQEDAFENEFISLYKESLKNEKKDEYENFGGIVASRLREIAKRSTDEAFNIEVEILNLLRNN